MQPAVALRRAGSGCRAPCARIGPARCAWIGPARCALVAGWTRGHGVPPYDWANVPSRTPSRSDFLPIRNLQLPRPGVGHPADRPGTAGCWCTGGWMSLPATSSWWTRSHRTTTSLHPTGAATDKASPAPMAPPRSTAFGLPTTWPTWTFCWTTTLPTSQSTWWAAAWAVTWPCCTPGCDPERIRRLINLEGFGMPATVPAMAPGRYARWMDELNAHARASGPAHLRQRRQRGTAAS